MTPTVAATELDSETGGTFLCPGISNLGFTQLLLRLGTKSTKIILAIK